MDTRTELEIGKAMRSLMKTEQALSLPTVYPRLLTCAKRHIIEQGNHGEMLQHKGAYAELYNSQFA